MLGMRSVVDLTDTASGAGGDAAADDITNSGNAEIMRGYTRGNENVVAISSKSGKGIDVSWSG